MTIAAASATLDRRKGVILRAIVSDYVRTGRPVSSQRLVEKGRLNVSTATIRNEMGRLEEEGYLVQPYTSAGRIPTDLGYRWFVDNWPGPEWPNLTEPAQRAIKGAFEVDFKGMEDVLDSTSHLLSRLTESAAIAVAPPPMDRKLKRLDLFRRDSRRATLLLVADNGEVDQGVVEFTTDKTDSDLVKLSGLLNVELKGLALADLANKVCDAPGMNHERLAVSEEIRRITAHKAERIFRDGASNIFSPDKFTDIEVAHDILRAMEEPIVMSSLLKSAREAAAVLVFIGREIPVEEMRACAVVFAPYRAGSGRTGSVGVIGPTRMNYPQTISAVESVARSLSKLLEPTD